MIKYKVVSKQEEQKKLLSGTTKKSEKKIEKSLNEHLNHLILEPIIYDLTNDTNLMNDMKKIYSKIKRFVA